MDWVEDHFIIQRSILFGYFYQIIKDAFKMELVYLEIGGNQGDRWLLLDKVKAMISSRMGAVLNESSVYETPPWGFESDMSFYNQALAVQTNLEPNILLSELQQIEKQLGRVRSENRYDSRTMDIDVLFYGNQIIQTDNFTVPHPRMHLRKFVLDPLVEIASDVVHPVLHKTIRELWNECPDDSVCKRISRV